MAGEIERREAWVVGLWPERIDDYVRMHAAVWPELEAAMRAHGIGDYSIWLYRPEALLFQSYVYRGADYDRDMAALTALDVSQRWDALMGALQRPLPGETGWAAMSEVYRLA